ncbi:MAG: hypothetical protein GXO67_05250, partial [Archaeoglobi archaeon]|nr:hypothetical protein [Archaeoglobi archaeon]
MNRVGRNAPLVVFVFLLAVISIAFPEKVREYPGFVDWRAVSGLAGLLVITTGLRESGYLSEIAEKLAKSSGTERGIVLRLCLLSALLGATVTNDAAILVVVPITVSLSGVVNVRRAVTLEAISANAGSTLTPIGNPQNLLLWHQWGVSFTEFVASMLLPFLIQMLVLLALVTSVSGRSVVVRDGEFTVDRRLAALS